MQLLEGESDEKKENPEKGTRDEHTPELQWGSSVSADKNKESTDGLAVSLTVLQVHIESAQGASSRGIGCEMQQVQDQESMARVEPEVGNGPPPRSLTGLSTSTRSGVVAGEP